MKVYDLRFFKCTQVGICASDFDNKEETDKINIDYILSISGIKKFNTPFSGKFIGEYAVITMANNDHYYISRKSYNQFIADSIL